MSAQDNTQRFEIASPGSKLVFFTVEIIQGIFSIVMNQKRPLIGQRPVVAPWE